MFSLKEIYGNVLSVSWVIIIQSELNQGSIIFELVSLIFKPRVVVFFFFFFLFIYLFSCMRSATDLHRMCYSIHYYKRDPMRLPYLLPVSAKWTFSIYHLQKWNKYINLPCKDLSCNSHLRSLDGSNIMKKKKGTHFFKPHASVDDIMPLPRRGGNSAWTQERRKAICLQAFEEESDVNCFWWIFNPEFNGSFQSLAPKSL